MNEATDHEQWLSEAARELTVSGWAEIRRVQATGCASGRVYPDGLAPGGISLMDAGKIITYRDKVAAGLDRGWASMLTHALGGGHRNHYVCANDHTSADFVGWANMLAANIAERGRNINNGRDAVFRATDFGREVARVLGGGW